MQPKSVTDFTGPTRGSGEEINHMHCPVCGSQGWNVYLNTVTGKWFCFASGHGSGGMVATEDWSDTARAELLQLLSYGVPNTHTWPEVDLPVWRPLGPIAVNYLIRRDVQMSTCGILGIVELDASPRILVPYRGPHGRIIHWTGRAFGSEVSGAPKYLSAPGSKPLFMLPNWEAVSGAVLVEGPFDAIAVWQATGLPVISIGGKVLSKQAELDLRQLVRGKLWIMLDGDAQGAAMTLKDRLMDKFVCTQVMLQGRMDPADMPPDEIRRRIM